MVRPTAPVFSDLVNFIASGGGSLGAVMQRGEV